MAKAGEISVRDLEAALVAQNLRYAVSVSLFGIVAVFRNEQEARNYYKRYQEGGAPVSFYDLKELGDGQNT